MVNPQPPSPPSSSDINAADTSPLHQTEPRETTWYRSVFSLQNASKIIQYVGVVAGALATGVALGYLMQGSPSDTRISDRSASQPPAGDIKNYSLETFKKQVTSSQDRITERVAFIEDAIQNHSEKMAALEKKIFTQAPTVTYASYFEETHDIDKSDDNEPAPLDTTKPPLSDPLQATKTIAAVSIDLDILNFKKIEIDRFFDSTTKVMCFIGRITDNFPLSPSTPSNNDISCVQAYPITPEALEALKYTPDTEVYKHSLSIGDKALCVMRTYDPDSKIALYIAYSKQWFNFGGTGSFKHSISSVELKTKQP
ncbi:CreA family protein [uncultured Endozoicomonas sp.]|uniref:CreA family protein n=1 Tax=uncultured Endozoicomonas sp. TaxID=432652 RepID=UPI002608CB4E|nr:CreA family protein [uncultured Endozoicomonas sp.]